MHQYQIYKQLADIIQERGTKHQIRKNDGSVCLVGGLLEFPHEVMIDTVNELAAQNFMRGCRSSDKQIKKGRGRANDLGVYRPWLMSYSEWDAFLINAKTVEFYNDNSFRRTIVKRLRQMAEKYREDYIAELETQVATLQARITVLSNEVAEQDKQLRFYHNWFGAKHPGTNPSALVQLNAELDAITEELSQLGKEK